MKEIIESYTEDQIIRMRKELKKVAENCNCLGALLSFDKNKNVYTIWNGNKSSYDYWDPYGKDNSTPSTKYGNVIAVCAGKGKWIVLNWYGMNGNEITLNINGNDSTMRQGYMCWAHRDEDIYNTFLGELVYGDGYNNTKYVFFGHDHFNNFVMQYKGVVFSYGHTIDYIAYGKKMEKMGYQRGCTVIELDAEMPGFVTITHENYYQEKYQSLDEMQTVDMSPDAYK